MKCPYKEAKQQLTNPLIVSDRSHFQFHPFEEQGIELPKTKGFYKDWLMFMDGEQHKTYRNRLLKILSRQDNEKNSGAVMLFLENLREGGIGLAETTTAVRMWHRDFLGLSAEQQDAVFSIAEPILNFFFYNVLPENDPEKLEQQIDRLHDWLRSTGFGDGSLMQELLDSGIPDGLILNVIVDSYEPVLAVTTSLVANAERLIGNPVSLIIHEILKENPPFSFINRNDTTRNEFISIDLQEANTGCPEPRLNLSFGFGMHACPGAKASLAFLFELASVIQEEHKTQELNFETGQRESNTGMCRYTDFSLR